MIAGLALLAASPLAASSAFAEPVADDALAGGAGGDEIVVPLSAPSRELLQTDSAGRIAVTVQFGAPPGEAELAALADLAEINSVSPAYAIADVFVAEAELDEVRDLPGVVAAAAAPAPVAGGGGGARAPALGPTACNELPIDADVPLRADLARTEFGADGSTVTIGVISDSFAVSGSPITPEDDVASGALPGPGNPCGYTQPVTVIAESETGGSDEGRAMLQLVHGIAPGSRLLFATSGTSMFEMADNVRALVAAGADVIVDDISFLTSPAFQQGPIDVAVSEAVAAGVSYLSSAGNWNVRGAPGTASEGKDIASWETAAYRPMACPAELSPPPDVDCLDFDPGPGEDAGNGLVLEGTGTLSLALYWAEPFGGVDASFQAVLVDEAGVPAGSVPFLPSLPVQILTVEKETPEAERYELLLSRRVSAPEEDVLPRVKFLVTTAGPLAAMEWDESAGDDVVGPTIIGHNGGPHTISVAASPAVSPFELEEFSAYGPVVHYFGPAESIVPAAPLAEPAILQKPDVTAVDDVRTTFFGYEDDGGFWFSGTSAAAPNAAAVVALARDLYPEASADAVRGALMSTARPFAASGEGWPASGAGLVDAYALLGSLQPSSPAAPAPPRRLPATGWGGDAALAALGVALLAGAGASGILAGARRSAGPPNGDPRPPRAASVRRGRRGL